jgi:hypothetical protein
MMTVSKKKMELLGSVVLSIVSGAPPLADKAYSPNPVNVDAGNNVTWTNDDIQVSKFRTRL